MFLILFFFKPGEIIFIKQLCNKGSLVEYVYDLTIVIVTGILAIVGIVLGLFWGNLRKTDPSLMQAKESSYNETIQFLRSENNRLNGSINRQKQKFQVEGDYDLTQKSDVASLAKSVLPAIVDFLPENVQTVARSLLNDQGIIDLLDSFYKDHPEDIKRLLGGFLKGGTKKESSSAAQSETPAIQFDPAGA